MKFTALMSSMDKRLKEPKRPTSTICPSHTDGGELYDVSIYFYYNIQMQ